MRIIVLIVTCMPGNASSTDGKDELTGIIQAYPSANMNATSWQ